MMFSVPYWIHKFWEAQELVIQQAQTCNGSNIEDFQDEVLENDVFNSFCLICGCILWISLILSAIYHLIRMILFSNRTEPASIMCHY